MASRLPPYQYRKTGRDGFYFIRRVRLDMVGVVDKKFWRKLLAYDLATLTHGGDALYELEKAGKKLDDLYRDGERHNFKVCKAGNGDSWLHPEPINRVIAGEA